MPVPLGTQGSILHLPLDSRIAGTVKGLAKGRAKGRAPMTDNEPRRIGVSIEIKPHAYDPVANPELFEGVLARRLIAFVIDMIILAIPVVLAGIFMTAATI